MAGWKNSHEWIVSDRIHKPPRAPADILLRTGTKPEFSGGLHALTRLGTQSRPVSGGGGNGAQGPTGRGIGVISQMRTIEGALPVGRDHGGFGRLTGLWNVEVSDSSLLSTLDLPAFPTALPECPNLMSMADCLFNPRRLQVRPLWREIPECIANARQWEFATANIAGRAPSPPATVAKKGRISGSKT